MAKYMHVYNAKGYVLRTINIHMNKHEGDFNSVNILVRKNKDDKHGKMPTKYEELIDLLKDYDKVYDFYEWDSLMHGVKCYDIVLEGPEKGDE